MLRQLVVDLERRLVGEIRRNAALVEKLAAATAVCAEDRSARAKAEREAGRHCAASWTRSGHPCWRGRREAASGMSPGTRLDDVTVLYVGGRPNQVSHLRAGAELSGAAFLHHDGGIEHHLNLLAGLTSSGRSRHVPGRLHQPPCGTAGEAAVPPVEVKRFVPAALCQRHVTLAALRQPAISRVADAAD